MADSGRTAHATTQTLGLAMVSATLITVVVLTLLLFDGDDVGLFGAIALLVVAATVVTWRFDRQWARAIGLVGTVVSLGAFFLGFGLFQVFSPIEFTLAVAYVLGVILSLVGGIRALIAGRKRRMGPTRGEDRQLGIVVAVVGVAAVVSITGFVITRETVDDSEAAGATVLDMTKFEFEPLVSTLPVQGRLLIQNSDPFVHDFTLDELDLSVSIGPESETLVDTSGLAPGTYDYFCSLHYDGTSGMAGTIVISS